MNRGQKYWQREWEEAVDTTLKKLLQPNKVLRNLNDLSYEIRRPAIWRHQVNPDGKTLSSRAFYTRHLICPWCGGDVQVLCERTHWGSIVAPENSSDRFRHSTRCTIHRRFSLCCCFHVSLSPLNRTSSKRMNKQEEQDVGTCGEPGKNEAWKNIWYVAARFGFLVEEQMTMNPSVPSRQLFKTHSGV